MCLFFLYLYLTCHCFFLFCKLVCTRLTQYTNAAHILLKKKKKKKKKKSHTAGRKRGKGNEKKR